MIDQGDDLGVCAVNVAEFFAGLAAVDRPYWRRVFATLAYWEIAAAAAAQAGQWRYDFGQQGTTLAVTDTLIAAVAREVAAVLVTNNARHYPMPGIHLEVLR
jgi:predicted nucleic acid-binding protein